ncbi:hypothetical protein ACFQ06_16435, partial [Tessaracoccus lubricantis]
MGDADKAWEQLMKRAAEGRIAGLRADSDDEIDDSDLGEAAINPHAVGSKGRKGAGGPSMMPPMMGAPGGAGGRAAAPGGVLPGDASGVMGGGMLRASG